MLLAAIIIARLNPSLFKSAIVQEDGWLEWSTVVSLLFLCGLTLKRAFTRFNINKAGFIVLCGYALVFLFGAGEEISWGQRLFGIEEIPGYFSENNVQNELNFHNLKIGGISINKLIFGKIMAVFLAVYFLFLRLLHSRNESIRKLVDFFYLPLPKISHTVVAIAWVLLIEISGSSKKGELFEFALPILFVLIFLNPWNKRLFAKKA